MGGAFIFVSLQHFIAPALDLMPACPPNEGGRHLMDLRAKLDLMSTKYFYFIQKPILQLIDNCTCGTIPFPSKEIFLIKKILFGKQNFISC